MFQSHGRRDPLLLVVMLRFLLQWVRADFYNPLVQFVVKLSNPALVPLRRVIPGLMGVDMAALVLVILLGSLRRRRNRERLGAILARPTPGRCFR